MAEPTNSEREVAAELAAQARERGREQLEGAKGEFADRTDRVAEAVERTADELESDGDSSISGVGRSLASVMRQLSGGLRERDIDDFARELGDVARRNPGLFLAGSVALGFGVARFFKARPGQSARGAGSWRTGGMRTDVDERYDFDSDESLDLSANTRDAALHGEGEAGLDSRARTAGGATATSSSDTSSRNEPKTPSSVSGSETRASDERNQSKSRSGGKAKAKPQRSSAQGQQSPSEDPYPSPLADRPTTGGGSGESAFTGGVGGGPIRGGKGS
jgi:hypothetical protein